MESERGMYIYDDKNGKLRNETRAHTVINLKILLLCCCDDFYIAVAIAVASESIPAMV